MEFEYKKTYGHNIPLTRMGLDTMEDLVGVSLQSWVRLTDGVQGSMVVTVDRGFIRTMASNVRKFMVEQETGAMDYEEFVNIMATRYVSYTAQYVDSGSYIFFNLIYFPIVKSKFRISNPKIRLWLSIKLLGPPFTS